MDNQNNPNLPNNPNPVPPSSPPPPPPSSPWDAVSTPMTPPQPEPSPWPPNPTVPEPVDPQPSPTPWSIPASPTQRGEPAQPEPVAAATPEPVPTWTPPVQAPVQPAHIDTQSVAGGPESTVPDPAPIAVQEPVAAQPSPTFTPPPAVPAEPAAPSSPLDNPWGAPAQAPTIDNPQTATTTTQPSWSVPTPAATPTESAPTDLSHLINSSQEAQQPLPENLVIPSAITPNPEVSNTVPPEHHRGIPKWLIGLGIGLLILVLGTSAYFILGVGQPAKTASLPAATTSPAKPVVSTASPIPQPTEQAVASGSAANFGDLQGGGTQGATGSSTIDTLRRRNQGL